MAKNITLLVLAAGVGKRFWPFGTSKALFPFFGLPMFAHTIGEVPDEISRMIIVTNPQNDSAVRANRFPVETSTVVQQEPKGMADAILASRSAIGTDPLLIVNVDDVVDPELLTQVVTVAQKTGSFGVIPGWKTDVYRKTGYLEVSGNRVTGFVEKPEPGDEPSAFINVVVHYIRDGSGLIRELEVVKSGQDDAYEKALSQLAAKNVFEFLPYDGPMAALKYPWHVLDVMDELLEDIEKYRGKGVEVKSNVIIEGDVIIEDNVKIFENTKIVGPCYIGKNTIIGNNCIIRASHIGANSVVGFNTEVVRSYVGDNCWFHANYIGDSVLEGNVSMGGGAKLANVRLDDGEISSRIGGKKFNTARTKLGAMIARGVRIGINASIMPGVKIGANSFIGAGVTLDRDLPEQSFCMEKPGYVISKNKKTAPLSREHFRDKI